MPAPLKFWAIEYESTAGTQVQLVRARHQGAALSRIGKLSNFVRHIRQQELSEAQYQHAEKILQAQKKQTPKLISNHGRQAYR